MEDNYIYNQDKNLRTTLGVVNYFPMHMPGMGPVWLTIVNCEDRCAGHWNMKKSYTGLVTEKHNHQAIQQVMHTGSSTSIMSEWLRLEGR